MEVLYEDNHIIVVNKTCNEIVQGDKTGDKTLIDLVGEYLKKKYNKPGNVFVGLTHRLDRPTSGAVIFAKTSKALERMNKMFAEHSVKKTYWAIVKNRPEEYEGRLEHFMVKNEAKNKSKVCKARDRNAKKAVLTYKLVGATNYYSLLEVNLETGRHHQIRCQLAYIGCPVKGDLKYGAERSNPDGGISLHARRVEFIHPVSKEKVDVVAPVPDDVLWKEFESMQA